ncbi:uncharacterized protein Tco025E_01104 [Trypanosoma conorhini]|uniref:Uncharacterized protein n=1 Tax=Trypanosoma conorhini TaxID=83891 RepID=A0A422Q9K1_9TRYP|nr:uncharacterized protein Tco025E_01104 [Trypanosoma conorhini]RNF26642.1 hypothetical protein Tco025E_01104 [Trypanosoma conorhini]
MPLAAAGALVRRLGHAPWATPFCRCCFGGGGGGGGTAVLRRLSSLSSAPFCATTAAAAMSVGCGTSVGALCCQRRHQGALHKLLHDHSDPYLQPIEEVDLPQLAAVATAGGGGPQHLLDGLTAATVVLAVQVRAGAATPRDADAAFAVYAAVMCLAPGAASGADGNAGGVSAEAWRSEWEGPLEEFRAVFRRTGDSRIP